MGKSISCHLLLWINVSFVGGGGERKCSCVSHSETSIPLLTMAAYCPHGVHPPLPVAALHCHDRQKGWEGATIA